MAIWGCARIGPPHRCVVFLAVGIREWMATLEVLWRCVRYLVHGDPARGVCERDVCTEGDHPRDETTDEACLPYAHSFRFRIRWGGDDTRSVKPRGTLSGSWGAVCSHFLRRIRSTELGGRIRPHRLHRARNHIRCPPRPSKEESEAAERTSLRLGATSSETRGPRQSDKRSDRKRGASSRRPPWPPRKKCSPIWSTLDAWMRAAMPPIILCRALARPFLMRGARATSVAARHHRWMRHYLQAPWHRRPVCCPRWDPQRRRSCTLLSTTRCCSTSGKWRLRTALLCRHLI